MALQTHHRNIRPGWNRMASVSVLICCLSVLGKLQLCHEDIAVLLDALMLTVDIESKSCTGIDFLLFDFPLELRYVIHFLNTDSNIDSSAKVLCVCKTY